MDDIALIVGKEFRDYCDKVCRCSECKYEGYDIPCEVCYIADNFYLIRKPKIELEEEFDRFCESQLEDCSGCKYEHCDMSCKIDYISDKLCLIRKDDENED